ncbi:hypothetical protein [Haloarchaeobius sp. TZWWS8]|uniref:hypothetical protein n=1 Tax=Haloarchaeobius sp. TZWWS8 TaxID=3446121 RepID=UPI003EBF94ED
MPTSDGSRLTSRQTLGILLLGELALLAYVLVALSGPTRWLVAGLVLLAFPLELALLRNARQD